VETGNHYVLCVKGNQPNLLVDAQRMRATQAPVSTYEKEEKNKGRLEKRVVSTFEVQSEIMPSVWTGLQTYVHIERTRHTKDGMSIENVYYISDWSTQQKDAEYFYQITRGHWKIENNLHHTKDIVHKEDKNKLKDKGAIVASVMSSVAINLSRKEGYQSIEDAQIIFRADVEKALQLIRT
jgi:predicted transposase YbfD/YdcC